MAFLVYSDPAMPFDPVIWACGFGLSQLTQRVAKRFVPDELQAALSHELDEWAATLPAACRVPAEWIFGDTSSEPDPTTRPARFRLQAELVENGRIPPEDAWAEAFFEHWQARRAELGDEGNVFFRLPTDEAREHLVNLARRTYRCCAANTQLSHRTINFKLDGVLRRQERLDRIGSLPLFAKDLSRPAQDLVLDRPAEWEYRLFSVVLEDELAEHSGLKQDFDRHLDWGQRLAIPGGRVLTWLGEQLSEITQLTQNLEVLVEQEFPAAIGSEEQPADPRRIVNVARKIAEVHKHALEWALRLRRVETYEDYSTLVSLVEPLAHGLIQGIEDCSETTAKQLESVLAGEGPAEFLVRLETAPPEGLRDRLFAEMDRLRALRLRQAAESEAGDR